MRIHSIILGALALTMSLGANAQTLSDVMLTNAVSFLDVPYQAGTLEVNAPDEDLVINCDELDCVTLIEYAAAMSLTPKDENGDIDEMEFASNVQKLRYRDGQIEGYTSRLHYMTEWVENAVKAGLLEDVTAANSQFKQTVALNYMTTHSNLYPQLSNGDNLSKMKQIEQNLSGRQVSYIPKNTLPNEGFNWIKDGDIILITSAINGLDVAHCGVAFNISGKLTLLHASSESNKVVVSKYSVKYLLDQNDSWSGIRVLRLKK